MSFDKINSWAKINLSLNVVKRFRSKYHKIESLITFVEIFDEIKIRFLKGKKNKIKQWLMEVLPTTKERDIDTLIELNTIEGIKDYATQHGISDKQIKKIFS